MLLLLLERPQHPTAPQRFLSHALRLNLPGGSSDSVSCRGLKSVLWYSDLPAGARPCHSIIAAHPGHRQKLLIVETQTIPQEFSLLGFGGFSLLSSWDMPNFLPFLMSSFHVFSSWFMLQSPLQIKPLNVYCVLILW